MKQCIACGETKPNDSFHKRGKNPDGTQRYRGDCKECRAKADHKYYKKNGRNLDTDKERIRIRREFVYKYLRENPCVDCGESDIRCLEFDHVRGEKFRTIGELIARKVKFETIQAEMDKCEVRCANCHRRVTAERGGWAMLDFV